MACERGHTHLIVFTHACGYYSRAATIRGAASIRINTVAINLFVRRGSRVPLTSQAVCLVRSNNVGVVFTKMGVAKKFASM